MRLPTRLGCPLLLAGVALLAAGCAPGGGRWTRADYDLSRSRPSDATVEPLTSRIYLIADNQRHELLGNRVRLYRMSVSDELTNVAIRPPQLDLFGQDLLGEALTLADGFVLHLGDACNISTTGEFGRFAWDMRKSRHGWVMAPGNHDGFFFGNASRLLPNLVREWDESGETYVEDKTDVDSRALQKDRFVSYYLAALILQDAVWSAPLARELAPEIERQFLEWRRRAGDDATTFARYWVELQTLQDRIYGLEPSGAEGQRTFELPAGITEPGRPHLRRISWRIAKKLMWRSFVVQEVDISAPSAADEISILVLDSSQYGAQPSLEAGAISGVASEITRGYFDQQVAGEHGNVLESQLEAATAFTRSMEAEGRRWLLATHHPYRDLGRKTKPRFDRLRDAGGIPVTLSAHSHTGEILWNRDDKREGDWLEINVGSVLDTPAEFRDFQVHRLDDRLAIASRRYRMEDRLRERGLLADGNAEYRPVSSDPDFYMNYENRGLPGASRDDWSARKADFKVKHLLLAAYARMLDLFEADHPDQSATHWPTAPDGSRLDGHEAVIRTVRTLLADAQIDDLEALTAFLYELREFDRTRRFGDALGERLRSYRLSQAIWAGHAEYRTWPARPEGLDPELSFLVLPPAASSAGPSR